MVSTFYVNDWFYSISKIISIRYLTKITMWHTILHNSKLILHKRSSILINHSPSFNNSYFINNFLIHFYNFTKKKTCLDYKFAALFSMPAPSMFHPPNRSQPFCLECTSKPLGAPNSAHGYWSVGQSRLLFASPHRRFCHLSRFNSPRLAKSGGQFEV